MTDNRPLPVERFDYLAKLFGRRLRDDLIAYLSGNRRGPLIVDLDPTTACNMECPECISAELLNKGKLPTHRLEELISEIHSSGAKAIVFIGGGEPLAHSCMPRPIVQAHNLGLSVGLTTNGTLIRKHISEIAECVSWTRVSMDAGTEATFKLFRPTRIRDAFRNIIDGMRLLANVKRGALGYSFLVIQRQAGSSNISNVSDIYQAAKLAKDIGCDYIEIKPMFDNNHSLIPFSQGTKEVLREQHDLCSALADGSFHIINTASIAHLKQGFTDQPKSYRECPTMSLRTLITPNGIYPCGYHRGRDDKKLAGIEDAPFDVTWNAAATRTAATQINPRIDCSFYCARHGINRTIIALKELGADGIDLLRYITPNDTDDVFF
jgi:MoaA/NifB/PqqE/SkfB family radical SAM enzyme